MPVSWFYGHPMIQRINRPETSLADRKWNYSVQIGDFNAEQVKVKVEDGKVIIYAKYTDGNDEWGDTVVRTRTVQIPENVDSEKLHSFMKPDGTMMLEARTVCQMRSNSKLYHKKGVN
ncbi:unnamed protein product [Mytilus edulis]|uniref:SHSP domain-containing protein n=1 Tax=Mytilus edulis TaxID=6550 RepID=A0A8S3Q5U6_MYTED|nr:unnamed protein product [Mytilus edulis]